MQPDFSGSGQNASGTINQSSPIGPGGVQAIYNAVQPAVQGAVGNLWSGHPIGQLLGVNTAYAAGTTNPISQGVQGASTGPGAVSPTGGFSPVPSGGNNGSGSSNNGSSGGSGGGPGYNPSFPGQTVSNGGNTWQSQLQNGVLTWTQQSQNAAAQQAAANIAAASNMYNNLKNQLETQRPVIQSAFDTGNANIQQQLDTGTQQANQNTSQLGSAYQVGQGQQQQQLQDTQAQNREMARAVGGNGSDYAQLQNRTNNAYMNNASAQYNDYSSRLTQIQQGQQSLQNWGQAQKAQLSTQYQQGINQLVLNEDMTDFSKAQAIQQIQSDYTKQLSSISGVVAQMGGQLAIAEAQAQQYLAAFGKASANFNPMSDASNLFFGGMSNSAPTVDTSGGINYNKPAGGINNTTGAAGF